MKLSFILIPILSLLFSAQAFGAGSAPRIDTIEVQSLPNHIINGDITFNQRGNITGATSGVYFVDRFSYVNSSTAVHNIGSSADVPTVAQSGRKSTNSLYLVLTTADTSVGASDIVFVRHKVEGYNWAQLYGKSFTLSFWVKATTTGSYSVGFRDGSNTVAYVAPYTITASDTWEKKSIAVPAPAIGTWVVDNTTGLDIAWTVASGTTYQTATTGSWVSGSYIGGTSQTNGVNTGSTVFKLSQVMLNTGDRAAPFALAGGTVGGELLLAQRYYRRWAPQDSSQIHVFSGTALTGTDTAFAVPNSFRASPVVGYSALSHWLIQGLNGGTNYAQAPTTLTLWKFDSVSGWANIRAVTTNAMYAGNLLSNNASAWISLDAEL